MNGALYPDDFPEEPVAGITDDEVEDFLASIGKGARTGDLSSRLYAVRLADDLRGEAAVLCFAAVDAENGTAVPVELVLRVAGLLRQYADLLDGDR